MTDLCLYVQETQIGLRSRDRTLSLCKTAMRDDLICLHMRSSLIGRTDRIANSHSDWPFAAICDWLCPSDTANTDFPRSALWSARGERPKGRPSIDGLLDIQIRAEAVIRL